MCKQALRRSSVELERVLLFKAPTSRLAYWVSLSTSEIYLSGRWMNEVFLWNNPLFVYSVIRLPRSSRTKHTIPRTNIFSWHYKHEYNGEIPGVQRRPNLFEPHQFVHLMTQREMVVENGTSSLRWCIRRPQKSIWKVSTVDRFAQLPPCRDATVKSKKF